MICPLSNPGIGKSAPASSSEMYDLPCHQRELFIDNLLVRIHFIIVMIRWTGLAPWEFELPFPDSPATNPHGWTNSRFSPKVDFAPR